MNRLAASTIKFEPDEVVAAAAASTKTEPREEIQRDPATVRFLRLSDIAYSSTRIAVT
jgi:hypothetical protein